MEYEGEEGRRKRGGFPVAKKRKTGQLLRLRSLVDRQIRGKTKSGKGRKHLPPHAANEKSLLSERKKGS